MLPIHGPEDKSFDLVGWLDLHEGVECSLHSLSIALQLVHLMCLKLCEEVPENGHAILVEGLQVLEDIRGLGIPVGLSGIEVLVHVVGVSVSLRPLVSVFQFVQFPTCSVDITRNRREVILSGVELLEVAARGAKVTQRSLDIGLDFAGKDRVRLGEGVDTFDNIRPWGGEDSTERVSQ